MAKWIVEHDSHKEKKGEIYSGKSLPFYLEGKAKLLQEVEVNTPNKEKSKQKNEGNV